MRRRIPHRLAGVLRVRGASWLNVTSHWGSPGSGDAFEGRQRYIPGNHKQQTQDDPQRDKSTRAGESRQDGFAVTLRIALDSLISEN
jgi:hypothetical protein